MLNNDNLGRYHANSEPAEYTPVPEEGNREIERRVEEKNGELLFE